jgi:hypothetical protein
MHHIFFVIIPFYMMNIMTLERREQKIVSVVSIEILYLTLDSSQVVIFRVDPKPQVFALVQIFIFLKLKNAYRLLDQEILVEILCRFYNVVFRDKVAVQ